MLEPINFPLKMYEGVDFDFSFRIKENDVALDVSDWIFTMTIANRKGGTVYFTLSSEGLNPAITVDADNEFLITARIPGANTISDPNSLVYKYDAELPDGSKQRRFVGDISTMKDLQ